MAREKHPRGLEVEHMTARLGITLSQFARAAGLRSPSTLTRGLRTHGGEGFKTGTMDLLRNYYEKEMERRNHLRADPATWRIAFESTAARLGLPAPTIYKIAEQIYDHLVRARHEQSLTAEQETMFAAGLAAQLVDDLRKSKKEFKAGGDQY